MTEDDYILFGDDNSIELGIERFQDGEFLVFLDRTENVGSGYMEIKITDSQARELVAFFERHLP